MRVAIIGGGIGGLTLAIALRQRGIECEVHLLARVKGFPPPVSALIAATAESAIIRTDLYDFDPFRGWHRGRVWS